MVHYLELEFLKGRSETNTDKPVKPAGDEFLVSEEPEAAVDDQDDRFLPGHAKEHYLVFHTEVTSRSWDIG